MYQIFCDHFPYMVNQIFRDHFPFIEIALILCVTVSLVPGQSRWARRQSWTMVALACLYAGGIAWLYHSRLHLGESYAYLILGDLLGIVVGIAEGVVLVSWVIAYDRGRRFTSRRDP